MYIIILFFSRLHQKKKGLTPIPVHQGHPARGQGPGLDDFRLAELHVDNFNLVPPGHIETNGGLDDPAQLDHLVLGEGQVQRCFGILALLAGIGFTMSLFIAALAFTDAEVLASAKMGILAASLVAAVIGTVALLAGPAADADTGETDA